MKKVLLLAAVAVSTLFGTQASAQLERGNILVGGNLANINFGLGQHSTVSFDITPKLGYFIANDVAIGGYVRGAYSKTQGTDGVFGYGVGAFGRYYFNKNDVFNPLKDGRFFLEASAGIGGQTGTEVGGQLAFGPGYAYFITPNVALEAMVQVQALVGTGSSTGLNVGVGFQIYLPTAKVVSEGKKIRREVEDSMED